MALQVYSILVLDKTAVGVRFYDRGIIYDVELESLTGVKREHLKGYKIQTLIPHGDYLMTEEEIKQRLVIENRSNDPHFCRQASRLLISPPKRDKRLFKVVVESEEYNPIKKQMENKQFVGEFEAKTALLVRRLAKQYYASELNSQPEDIKIVDVKMLRDIG